MPLLFFFWGADLALKNPNKKNNILLEYLYIYLRVLYLVSFIKKYFGPSYACELVFLVPCAFDMSSVLWLVAHKKWNTSNAFQGKLQNNHLYRRFLFIRRKINTWGSRFTLVGYPLSTKKKTHLKIAKTPKITPVDGEPGASYSTNKAKSPLCTLSKFPNVLLPQNL